MRFKAIGTCIAIGIAAAAIGIDTQSRAVGPITTAERQQAEFELAKSRVVDRLKAALGEDFAGAWFDPSTGLLHIGVLSKGGRQIAGAVAERARVPRRVVETPVRSSWQELEKGQQRWSRILADLFDRAEVLTWLSSQENAVMVEVGSLVPASRRSQLAARAAADGVNVVIEIGDAVHFRAGNDARCNAHEPSKASCDPTIVAGMRIQHEENTKEPCTAGPVVLPKDRSTAEKATERLILTAGHCFNEGTKKWFAFNKAETKLEIGTADASVNGHAADIGMIPIENDPKLWTKAGFIPVTPRIAPWNDAAPEPYPVVSHSEATEGFESCMSGQTSGTSCGKVLKLNVTLENRGGMTEVEAVRAPGDSGAPWYSRAYAKTRAGLVEGIHHGVNEGTGHALVQPLTPGLKVLKEKTGVDVELLTENNEERRHPVATAKSYPATVSAKGSETSDQFTAFGTTVSCTGNEFHGELTKASAEVEVSPVYTTCIWAGLPATFTNNGCQYKATLKEESAEGQFKAESSIVCPVGKSGIQFDMYSSHTAKTSGTVLCTLTVPPQVTSKSITLKNSGGDLIWEKAKLELIKVRIHRGSFLCPGSGTETESEIGVYHLNKDVTFTATGGGAAVDIDIGGE